MAKLEKGINDLETWCEQNGEQGQRLLDEWDMEENWKRGCLLAPCDVTAGSNIAICWKCRECGYQWEMPIAYRVVHGTNCIKCSGERMKKTIYQRYMDKGCDLLTFCKENEEWGQQLMEEWDYDYNLKEFGVTMADVLYHRTEKFRWICKNCKQPFFQSTLNRTKKQCGCARCYSRGTSYPEQFIYWSLKQIFPDTQSRAKLFGKLEYDVYVPEVNLCIEYSGVHWHKEKEERDKLKKTTCLSNGMKFIEIVEDSAFESISLNENRIEVPRKTHTRMYPLMVEVVKYIAGLFRNVGVQIDFKKADNLARKYQYERENNVAKEYPQLLEEWKDERKPETCTKYTEVKIKWKCARCNHVYHKELHLKVLRKSGCPKCGYSPLDKRIHKRSIKNLTEDISKYV